MSEHRRIQGGSSVDSRADTTGSRQFGFFKKKYLVPSQKTKANGRILPAFDKNLDFRDEAYPTSFMPYRDPDAKVDPDTKKMGFTGWYLQFAGYRFFGNSREDLVSPRSIRMFDEHASATECADPIQDCRSLAYSRKDSGDELAASLVDKPKDFKAYHALPSLEMKVVMNSYTQVDRKAHEVMPLILTQGAMGLMKRELCWPQGTNPRDPNFPQFMLGDITHPETGLRFEIVAEETNSFTVIIPKFTQEEFGLAGAQVMPVNKDILAQRLDFLDLSSMVIPTYQQLVDLLIAEGKVPLDLIKEACSYNADIGGTQRMGNVTPTPRVYDNPVDEDVPMGDHEIPPASGPATSTVGAPATPTGAGTPDTTAAAPTTPPPAEAAKPTPPPPAAPTPPPAAPTPPPPPAAPAKPEVKLWVMVGSAPELKTVSEIIELENTGGLSSDQFMPEDQSAGWAPLSTSNDLEEAKKAKAAPVESTPVTTSTPTIPGAAAVSEARATETHTAPAGDSGGVTPVTAAEQARYDELATRFSQKGNNLTDAEKVELNKLVQRINGQA